MSRIERVHYFDRQFLRTADFSDEQGYHLSMRRRHNLAHHRWGIVNGLELRIEDNANLIVLPGMAVDGYGREIVLTENKLLRNEKQLQQIEPDAFLEIWMLYVRSELGGAPRRQQVSPGEAENAFYRWQEQPRFLLKTVDAALRFDRRKPEEVPEANHEFSPFRMPPDDPQQLFPLYLGRVFFDPDDPEELYKVDRIDRPYAGLVGEEVTAVSGIARLRFGERDNNSKQFGVFFPDISNSEKELERLSVQSNGAIELRGNTTVRGAVTLSGGMLQFKGNANGAEAPIGVASPWSIHLAQVGESDEAANQQTEDSEAKDGEPQHNRLRIEMAEATTGVNAVEIGFWSTDENKFVECLTIKDDRSVTVHGDLHVEGKSNYKKGIFPGAIGATLRQLIESGFYTAIQASGGFVDPEKTLGDANEQRGILAASKLKNDDFRRGFVIALFRDTELLDFRLLKGLTGLAKLGAELAETDGALLTDLVEAAIDAQGEGSKAAKGLTKSAKLGAELAETDGALLTDLVEAAIDAQGEGSKAAKGLTKSAKLGGELANDRGKLLGQMTETAVAQNADAAEALVAPILLPAALPFAAAQFGADNGEKLGQLANAAVEKHADAVEALVAPILLPTALPFAAAQLGANNGEKLGLLAEAAVSEKHAEAVEALVATILLPAALPFAAAQFGADNGEKLGLLAEAAVSEKHAEAVEALVATILLPAALPFAAAQLGANNGEKLGLLAEAAVEKHADAVEALVAPILLPTALPFAAAQLGADNGEKLGLLADSAVKKHREAVKALVVTILSDDGLPPTAREFAEENGKKLGLLANAAVNKDAEAAAALVNPILLTDALPVAANLFAAENGTKLGLLANAAVNKDAEAASALVDPILLTDALPVAANLFAAENGTKLGLLAKETIQADPNAAPVLVSAMLMSDNSTSSVLDKLEFIAESDEAIKGRLKKLKDKLNKLILD